MNRLALEDSPYLQQHKNNPFDWYPWCDEAFSKAKKENKPIFLSIGYSSCHWCHVMEEEVFEDETIAKLVNESFVCIKLDKEERPDIDKYYQNLFTMLNGRGGGWPLSIFMTSELKPFYSATYIPPSNFVQIIDYFAKEYQNNLEELTTKATQINSLAKMLHKPNGTIVFDDSFIEICSSNLEKSHDKFYGGFFHAPKFPHTSSINLAIKLYTITKDEKLKQIALHTLQNMSKGGLYDIVDSGFCRYSVDEIWLVPHFEKMTYDNGLLIESYLNGYFISGDVYFLDIATRCSDFMLSRMSQNGLFYSASDADSLDKNGHKEEGAYFAYEYEELSSHFDDTTLKLLGVSKNGNFEGKNIIRNEDLAKIDDRTIQKLQDLRVDKPYPFIDKKVITAWNAMMIKSLFILSRTKSSYLHHATQSIDSLIDMMWIENKLYHSKLIDSSNPPIIEGFLEDYAYFADCLLEAYKTTLDTKYFDMALKLVDIAIEKFDANGRWFFSVDEFMTECDFFDGSYPSPVGVMLQNLITLGSIKNPKYLQIAHKTIEFYSSFIAKEPTSFASISLGVLRILKDDYIIKSNQENLKNIIDKIDLLDKPFVYLYENESEKYDICGQNGCFGQLDELF